MPPVESAREVVRRSGARPWLFAFVGVSSLCLTQMAYHYFRGAHSVYVDYERGCGEWCFEGEPTLLQYLLAKALPVACSFVAIAAATIFGRWASRLLTTCKCPCAVASGAGAGPGTAMGAQSAPPPTRPCSVKCGRPNMAELIEKAMAEVEAAPASAASSLTTGLYVCVCGPAAMVQSCKDAVRHVRRRHRGVPIGLHVEEPDW